MFILQKEYKICLRVQRLKARKPDEVLAPWYSTPRELLEIYHIKEQDAACIREASVLQYLVESNILGDKL